MVQICRSVLFAPARRSILAFLAFAGSLFVLAAMAGPVAAQNTNQMYLDKPATLVGSDASETLLGTAGNDVIVGMGGDDIIRGLGGNDLICGGPGNDRIFGDGGPDRLDGGGGNDVIQGGLGNDWIYGRTGNDVLFGAAGADRMFGNPGADTLWGGIGIDALNGDAGVDRVTGGPGNDQCRTQIGDTRASCPRSLPLTANRTAPTINTTFDNARNTLGPGFFVGGTESVVLPVGFATNINANYTGKENGSILFNSSGVCGVSNVNQEALTPGRYAVRFSAPGFIPLDVVWHLARGYIYCAVIEQVN